jgi:hypothetical protein
MENPRHDKVRLAAPAWGFATPQAITGWAIEAIAASFDSTRVIGDSCSWKAYGSLGDVAVVTLVSA